MINTIIIEDERPALENLENILSTISDIKVMARLGSVKESIDYLTHQTTADLILSDVQLGDGLSFEIFNQTCIHTPVIFITGYDEFILNAFEYNGIDYVLKPVDTENVRKALDKYRMLKKHFINQSSLTNLLQVAGIQKKKRIIVKKGLESVSLRLEDVALFSADNKIVYAIDAGGKKYLADKSLSELEEELDPSVFFRANRQYIININFVRGFKAYEKVKLMVELTLPEPGCPVIVSQKMAPQFKEWMHSA
jgi:DNA-binding LytR/AlgR family response regulator